MKKDKKETLKAKVGSIIKYEIYGRVYRYKILRVGPIYSRVYDYQQAVNIRRRKMSNAILNGMINSMNGLQRAKMWAKGE